MTHNTSDKMFLILLIFVLEMKNRRLIDLGYIPGWPFMALLFILLFAKNRYQFYY